MNKACIFDMDGVLINSEAEWAKREEYFLTELLGEKIFKKVEPHLLGGNTNTFYDIAFAEGFSLSREEFFQKYDEQAEQVYSHAELTEGIEDLIHELKKTNWQVGLVSSSRMFWIDCALKRMPFRDVFQYVVSVNDREDLEPKPAPDGYLEAMNHLGSAPDTTIIIEDSNTGIKAAKASGALTVCLKQNHPANYLPTGADIYGEHVHDLTKMIRIINS
jgi:HAD superfamily hydrolase (TIGR01509 family)